MSKSRIAVLFLVALAQQFTAANAFAESPCPPAPQKPDGNDGCDKPSPPPPPPPGPKPDLVPSINSVSFVGGKVTVATSISNQGDVAAGQAKTRIELFKRQGSGFAALPFHTQDIPSGTVQAAAALTLSAEAALVAGFNHKSYKVCVTADALAQVPETSENNNNACKQFLLAIPAVALP